MSEPSVDDARELARAHWEGGECDGCHISYVLALLAERDELHRQLEAVRAVSEHYGMVYRASGLSATDFAVLADLRKALAAASVSPQPETAEERAQVVAWFARYPDGEMATSRGRVRSVAEFDSRPVTATPREQTDAERAMDWAECWEHDYPLQVDDEPCWTGDPDCSGHPVVATPREALDGDE